MIGEGDRMRQLIGRGGGSEEILATIPSLTRSVQVLCTVQEMEMQDGNWEHKRGKRDRGHLAGDKKKGELFWNRKWYYDYRPNEAAEKRTGSKNEGSQKKRKS